MDWPQKILAACGIDSSDQILGFFLRDAEDEAYGVSFNKGRLERHKP